MHPIGVFQVLTSFDLYCVMKDFLALSLSYRVQSGHCLRLYTRWHYDKMLEYQLPEMLRTPLEELILQIKVYTYIAILNW